MRILGAGIAELRRRREVARRIASLPRVAGLATMPSRLGSLAIALPPILAQVDKLFLFLDGHDSVPAFARDPKIVVLHARDYVRLGCSGRYLGLVLDPMDCVYLSVDDDIIYPPNYVATLVRALARYGGRAVVGVHGERYRPPFASFRRSRVVDHFQDRMLRDRPVHALGGGTVAFLSSALAFDPRDWPVCNMDDLQLAITAERAGLPRICIRRGKNFLRAIAESQPDSLWKEAMRDESGHTRYVGELVRLMGVA
jgi:hypothetical protein